MKRRLAVLFGAICMIGATIASCGRDSTSPTSPSLASPAIPSGPSRLLGLSLQVPIIGRLAPLSAPVQWSFVASPLGSRSSNLATGLTVIVPAGAVSAPTTITVTAEAGAAVAYDFQPAGLHFSKPITIVQDLSLTSVLTGLLNTLLGKNVTGAYFSSSQLQYDPATGTGIVNEFEPTTTNWLLMQTSVKVSHFSGYTFASCNSLGF